MKRRSAAVSAHPLCLLMVAACARPRPSDPAPPRDSIELQALARREDARFARAVSAEPNAGRLEVEAVPATSRALVDRRRKLVYVLRPFLAAHDLITGAERWRLDAVSGASVSRLGSRLLVVGAADPKTPRLVLIDPESPRAQQTCDLRLPVPKETVSVFVVPFDRAGAPHVVWRGVGSLRRGGTPHSETELLRYRKGEACGVAALQTNTCSAVPARIGGFLLAPPRDKGAVVPIDSEDCRHLQPERDMPAVAASIPPQSDGRTTPTLHVVTTEAPAPQSECTVLRKSVLEARDASGAALWRQSLPDVVDDGRCPGPP